MVDLAPRPGPCSHEPKDAVDKVTLPAYCDLLIALAMPAADYIAGDLSTERERPLKTKVLPIVEETSSAEFQEQVLSHACLSIRMCLP